MIGGPAVDFAAVDPGEQHCRGLAELMVICEIKVEECELLSAEGKIMTKGLLMISAQQFYCSLQGNKMLMIIAFYSWTVLENIRFFDKSRTYLPVDIKTSKDERTTTFQQETFNHRTSVPTDGQKVC